MANSMKLLAWLCLASGALAWPLAAEEITVTVPPDPPAVAQPETQQPPAASNAPVAQDATPEANPTSPPDQSAAAPEPAPPQEPASPPAQAAAPEESAPATSEPPKAEAVQTPAPAAKKAETLKKKKPSHAANATPAKAKTKKAAASCKGLNEDACGTNSACIWVVGTPAEGKTKATEARCRSFAVLKKEAKKRHHAAKTSEPEVLPWAQQSSAGKSAGAGATSAVATSPAAVKQQ